MTIYFQYAVAQAIHGKELPATVYADKSYCGEPNRNFLNMDNISDDIMKKNQINAALTKAERESAIHHYPAGKLGSSLWCYGI